jgi:predicted NBD/HSP70 family sugar kinase
MIENFVVGVDIGGSHISVTFIDNHLEIIDHTSVSIDESLTPSKAVEVMIGCIDIISARLKVLNRNFLIEGVGIGCPGMILN